MALSTEELIEELSNKPIMEIVDLVKALEDKWGVSAAAPVAVATELRAEARNSGVGSQLGHLGDR